jgi:hypothetical protein
MYLCYLAKYYIKRGVIMRDTTKEIDSAMKGIEMLNHKAVLVNAVLAVAMFCIPALTISTILWQWLG